MRYGLSSWLLIQFPASSLYSKPPGLFAPDWTIHKLLWYSLGWIEANLRFWRWQYNAKRAWS